MRGLLLSTAALMFLAAPVFAQPHEDEHHSDRVGKASMGPQVQERAQAQARQQAQPPQSGGPERHDRGPAPQAAMANRDRGELRGDRGPGRQASIQAPQNRDQNHDQNREDWRGRPQASIQPPPNRDQDHGDNGRHLGRDNRAFNDNRPESRPDNRQNFNRDFNRDGRTDYRAQRFGGPRHDFSAFRDFHRNFQASRHFQVPVYRRPAGWYSHRWAFGEFLPAAFWVRDYWLIDFVDYDLPPPPYGAVWVRVDRDALLIDEDSGEIITVEYDVFY
jgi:Ni/Co efflux regulator RcnB